MKVSSAETASKTVRTVPPDRYLRTAPARIHIPTTARSSGVIPVKLPSGIVCASTATARMRDALARISSGVSSRTPSGAAGIPGVVGALEWHPAQRRATIRRTSANETPPPTVANAGPDRGAVTRGSGEDPHVPLALVPQVEPVAHRDPDDR